MCRRIPEAQFGTVEEDISTTLLVAALSRRALGSRKAPIAMTLAEGSTCPTIDHLADGG